jgi:hypothetical protein
MMQEYWPPWQSMSVADTLKMALGFQMPHKEENWIVTKSWFIKLKDWMPEIAEFARWHGSDFPHPHIIYPFPLSSKRLSSRRFYNQYFVCISYLCHQGQTFKSWWFWLHYPKSIMKACVTWYFAFPLLHVLDPNNYKCLQFRYLQFL